MDISGIRAFDFDYENARILITRMQADMRDGLAGNKSHIRMLPAYAWPPCGRENGKHVAIDFGGTKLRVSLVNLDAPKRHKAKSRVYPIPDSIRCGSGESLFAFIADACLSFIGELDPVLVFSPGIALTFSFPMQQDSISSGRLITWTKGFTASDVVGKDAARLLTLALEEKGYSDLSVATIANDTVTTLAYGRYLHPDCRMGVILGTGTNGACIERIENIKKCDAFATPNGEMIINMEWGAFRRVQTNLFDWILDKQSSNPEEQIFEKMVSGHYLGELASHALNEMIQIGCFSPGIRKLEQNAFLSTEELSMIAASHNDVMIYGIMAQRDRCLANPQEPYAIRLLAQAVFRRSARLAATMIKAAISKNGRQYGDSCKVAIDGSLYEKAPYYKEEMIAFLDRLHQEGDTRINLFHPKDASSIGCAVIAAAAQGMLRKK